MLRGKNDGSETGLGKAIVLGCADTARIAAATVVLAEVPILGSQIKASGNDGSALDAGADIKVFPVFKG